MEPQNNLRLLLLCLVLTAARARLSPAPSPSDSPLSSISEPPVEADLSALPPSTPLEELSPDWLSDQPGHSDDLPSSIFSTSLLSVGPNPIISKICDNTDHPPLCLATVLPFAKGEKSIDVQSVLKFAVEASSLYANQALSETKKLASKPGTPEDLKATLKDCKNSYETAVENFAKTVDAFSTNDVGTMRSVLSAVITFVGDCEDEFAQMQTQSPLSGYAEKLTDMTSNCLAIVSQMMN
ncbi:hypothetical protein CASFOL_021705 [Castilleja foliolosa]|uniref:Pectinesterase inhibitor domain-containing protein n=1 Tax=Castilleja foliolosa TaxID=1961234 RepID=A0ABD3CZD0_9LAMI